MAVVKAVGLGWAGRHRSMDEGKEEAVMAMLGFCRSSAVVAGQWAAVEAGRKKNVAKKIECSPLIKHC